MRSSRPENLSEHAMEVAMIAHALCTIGNLRFGRHLNADRAAVIGLFHDASEIITGDMPTPVKYYNREIRNAYKAVEEVAESRLVGQLPEDMKEVYSDIFGIGAVCENEDEPYLRGLVKAADKLSALIKCIDEEYSGNSEFSRAKESTRKAIDAMKPQFPEIAVFEEEFLPSYGKTLDELLEEPEKPEG